MGQYTTGEIRKIIESRDQKLFSLIPKEEIDIFLENEERRQFFYPAGIKNLYAGICEKAVSDYKTAHKLTLFKGLKTGSIERNIESFFGTELFLRVSGLYNKEHAIKTIEKTMLEERKNKLRSNMV